jgi:CubicO group peptidase (beta-lactamase class C family)
VAGTFSFVTAIDLKAVDRATDALFAPDAAHGLTLALVVMQSGVVVAERYGIQPDTVFGPGGPVAADTTLISWSMAKSITHAAVGILVGEGRLQLDEPAPVPEWKGTPKAEITLQHLLNMRPGLEFVEDYVDDAVSHCLEMLYGVGKDDMAAYAAGLPLLHEPGSVWNYSSGTTNIVSRIVGQSVGGGEPAVNEKAMTAFLHDRLFGPVGMNSAIPKFDAAGTFIGSSYVYATARDFARFGELYRCDGVAADGTRVLPAGWRDHARALTAHDPDGFDYGAHWWLWPDFPGSLGCHGYEGQYTVVVPDRELVVMHLGKSPIELRPILLDRLRDIFRAAK